MQIETKILMTTQKLLIIHDLNKIQMNAWIQCVHIIWIFIDSKANEMIGSINNKWTQNG